MKVLTKASHFISWHRRVIAVALAVVGLLALTSHLAAPPRETVAAVTLRHELSAGQTIASGDVVVRHLPPEAVPPEAITNTDAALGHVTLTSLGRNTVLTPSLFRHEHSTAPGRAIVPVVLHESALLPLLTPGAVVTLTTSHSEGTDVVTSDAVIVALPQQESSGPLAPGGVKNVVVVDVPAELAQAVATLGQQGALGIVLGGG